MKYVSPFLLKRVQRAGVLHVLEWFPRRGNAPLPFYKHIATMAPPPSVPGGKDQVHHLLPDLQQVVPWHIVEGVSGKLWYGPVRPLLELDVVIGLSTV
jgi:hypothetical protein